MKKKILTLSLVVALAATALIGGTLAYFTDTDDATNEFTVGNVDIELDEPEWDENKIPTIMPGKVIVKDPVVTVQKDSEDCYLVLEMELNKYVSLINLMGVDAYMNGIGGLDKTKDYPGFAEFMDELANDNALRSEVVNRWFNGITHTDWVIMNMDEIKAAVAAVPNKQNPSKLNIKLGYQGGNKDGVLSANETVQFMKSFTMPETVTQSMMDGDDAYTIDGVSKSNFNTDSATFKITFTAHAIQAEEIDDLQAAYDALFD